MLFIKNCIFFEIHSPSPPKLKKGLKIIIGILDYIGSKCASFSDGAVNSTVVMSMNAVACFFWPTLYIKRKDLMTIKRFYDLKIDYYQILGQNLHFLLLHSQLRLFCDTFWGIKFLFHEEEHCFYCYYFYFHIRKFLPNYLPKS